MTRRGERGKVEGLRVYIGVRERRGGAHIIRCIAGRLYSSHIGDLAYFLCVMDSKGRWCLIFDFWELYPVI